MSERRAEQSQHVDLDRAWAEAESALPDDWSVRELYRLPSDEMWLATAAFNRSDEGPADSVEGFGRTPQHALRVLASNLTRRTGKSRPIELPDAEHSLAAAWAEAERELPEDWTIREVYRLRSGIWMAGATMKGSMSAPGNHGEAFGPLPYAALLALAAELRLKQRV